MAESNFQETIQDWLAKVPSTDPVVVLLTHNRYEQVLQSLESLLKEPVALVVIDDGSTDRLVIPALKRLNKQYDFLYLQKESSDGSIATINQAFSWFAPHDVVILRSDTLVPAGWLPRLKKAAYRRTNIATATAFSNYGGMLSVPHRNASDPSIASGLNLEQVDKLIQQTSIHLTPVVPATFCHCVYYKRNALEAVGFLDEALPDLVAETDFSHRANAAGYMQVVADDLFVFYKGLDFIEPDQQAGLQAGLEALQDRYPWFNPWLNEASGTRRSTLAVALEAARAAFLGYRVAVDATILKLEPDGTQIWTIELIRALATNPIRRKLCPKVHLIVQNGVSQRILKPVEDLLDDLEIVPYSVMQSLPKAYFDILFRPLQLQSLDNLYDFRNVTARFVLTQLDFIGYSNPSYHSSFKVWNNYRHLTEFSFAAADGVTFFSNDTLDDALLQGMELDPERSCIIGAGVDHHFFQAPSEPPAKSDLFANEPFLLMLGTNYKHKRRSFAVDILKFLRRDYGWNGHLVMAGPSMPWGSSAAEEALQRLEDRDDTLLGDHLHYLGAVSEGEKRWLLEKSALVLYPSNYEGFGLVPFEAASVGTPCLTALSTSVQEVLGDDVVYLESYDPAIGAKQVWEMVSSEEKAQCQVEAINRRAQLFTWQGVADKTWQFFEKLLKMPPCRMEATEQPDLDRGLKAAYLDLQEEYTRLKSWADELNQRVIEVEGSRGYRIIKRLTRP